MNPELTGLTPTAINCGGASMGLRRLFYAHVGALGFTGIVVVPLLLGVTSIPSWVSVAYCSVITAVAIVFVIAAVHLVRNSQGQSVLDRIEYLSVAVGLSMAQVLFVLPVLLCLYTPNLWP